MTKRKLFMRSYGNQSCQALSCLFESKPQWFGPIINHNSVRSYFTSYVLMLDVWQVTAKEFSIYATSISYKSKEQH